MSAGWAKGEWQGDDLVITAGGDWDVRHAAILDGQLRRVEPGHGRRLRFDLASVERLDTAGAWLVHRTVKQYAETGVETSLSGLKPVQQAMLEQVSRSDRPCDIVPPSRNALVAIVERVGLATVSIATEAKIVVGFFGLILAVLGRSLVQPWRIRWTPLIHHMEKVGLNALPIVALISFLIGVVLAYQGATQLQRFGADIFVVDLIAVSILREIGILLTAIVIAGRSGSAFTAEIGTMMVHEEVDAMRTLGLDPIEVLVLPRLLALVLTLPMLAFLADMMGLLGGMLMAWISLDLSPGLFIERLNGAVSLWSFWIGIIKAPVFAFLIAMVGCLEGLRAQRSAESVGLQTTRSVVTSIFLVIVVDAIFSVFFAAVGV